MNDSTLIKLAQKLIQQPSVHPDHHGCHKIIVDYLSKFNFDIELMRFDNTLNLWAFHGLKKQQNRTLLFIGHTDVVEPGDLQLWDYPPFSGLVHNNILHGRGAIDMKGALAAMLVAATNFINQHPNHQGRIAFLITSDEEGSGINGTTKVVESLIKRNEHIDYCIVGEPSSQHQLGDIIKNGRRGSLLGQLTIHGSQGHVAYPQFLKNPIHLIVPALSDLLHTTWDQEKSILFPPTVIQMTNICSNSNNNNVTPHTVILNFNIRFNDKCSIDDIKRHTSKIFARYTVTCNIDWKLSAEPYFSNPRKLYNVVVNAIKCHQKFKPRLETTGGTSDGRFIAKMGAEIIELGALNHTIHKVNEYIDLIDLKLLSAIYQKIIADLMINTIIIVTFYNIL
ncbi:succinyl-diaminopimelate desuccinylase [Blochmannia endosymbiont of Camponotus sp. C-003]|uniref:succinyl-diaminopimelate desuccinylase n=1 Tax=unclassified Candidatus Blochmanniella TaxID=711328 RepID=UPI002024F66F|nr:MULTISPECIES: succinyl-diaminopimelate desuccinylase [unclassified Candidatus Blochmannia]URJ23321.1 succinyl-diaminopimelate desuccinylase [Blochmannia endosymbiont of Camponotus sp. C-003]URJ28794.1 succinyl-diaminopimelate desuccinylase [Blochmannia endosymbiont of Camponotus sp. C-046]